MNKYILLFCFSILCLISYAQTVTIGTQVWMAKNLDVSKFRNGDLIPQAQTDEEWIKAGENKSPAWCYYGDEVTKGTILGKLYNWYAVSDSRGLAPTGYHVPTYQEFNVLRYFLGKEISSLKMKSISGWNSYTDGGSTTCPNCATWSTEYRSKVACHTCKDTRLINMPYTTKSGNGNNSSGFNAFPGGLRIDIKGNSSLRLGKYGYWWTSSSAEILSEYNPTSQALNIELAYNHNFSISDFQPKSYGFSVRCLKD
jgi:hypothetical protein